MRLRRALIAAAIAAACTLTSAPPVVASTPTGGPIAGVAVGGSTTNGTHPITLTMTSATANISVFGIPQTIPCTGGSAAGVVRSGTLGVPQHEMTISSMSVTCLSILPSTAAGTTLMCHINVDFADNNVHTGLVDTGTGTKFNRVSGTMYLTNSASTNCVLVELGTGCTYRIGATSTVAFDEAVKTNGTQELILSGNTPRIREVRNCIGAISNGQGFTLNAVFEVSSPDGPIDFRPTAQPDAPKVKVDGSAAAADYDLDGVLESASATLTVFGIPLTPNCTSGTSSGTVHGGAPGPGIDPALTIEQLSLTCQSIFPGTTATMTVDQCDIDVAFDDPNVHDGLDPFTDDVDTGTGTPLNAVDGLAYLTSRTNPATHCLRVNISNGCQFWVGGQTTARFHEAIKTIGGTDYQTLELTGPGLQVKNPTTCQGAVAHNQPITIEASLNLRTPNGLIDFVPSP